MSCSSEAVWGGMQNTLHLPLKKKLSWANEKILHRWKVQGCLKVKTIPLLGLKARLALFWTEKVEIGVSTWLVSNSWYPETCLNTLKKIIIKQELSPERRDTANLAGSNTVIRVINEMRENIYTIYVFPPYFFKKIHLFLYICTKKI